MAYGDIQHTVLKPEELCDDMQCRRAAAQSDLMVQCMGFHCARCGGPTDLRGHAQIAGWSCNTDAGGSANVEG